MNGFDFVDKLLIFCIREVDFSGIHLERASVVGAVDILGSQMEVKVRQLVAIGTIVDFLRVESLLHGSCHLGDIGHK